MNADKGKPQGTIARLAAAEGLEASGDMSFIQSASTDSGGDSGSTWNAPRNSGSTRSIPDRIPVQDRLRAADMLIPGSRLGQGFSDEYRRIKRPLLANAFGKTASLVDRGNLILVTSSVPGEGKTHTAVNLALSIAQERDHTVLLVDCDVSKQGASRMLGLANRPGLVELLENGSFTLGDALLHTDVPDLGVLCAGKQHEYVTELLASQRMSSLVDEMVSRYDDRVIIFDGPPLLSTPQTQVLATLVGQVVMVVESGKTPQAVVEEAMELIPDDKAIGLVLNKSEGRRGHYYGYYGGYYGSDDGNKE